MSETVMRPALSLLGIVCAALVLSLIRAMPARAEPSGTDRGATRNLIHAGQGFSLPPNPNAAFELNVPANAVLTDVELTLAAPSLATTIYVIEMNNSQTYVNQLVATPGSTWGSNEGHYGIHLQSGISSPIGLRVGIYCNNIGGNGCYGALMWSGYQP